MNMPENQEKLKPRDENQVDAMNEGNLISSMLRDGLTRVADLQAQVKYFRRELVVIYGAVLTVLVVVGFFGYNRITDVEEKAIALVEKRISPQLNRVDSLVRQVSTTRLDSIAKLIRAKEKEFATIDISIAALKKESELAQKKQADLQTLIKEIEAYQRETARGAELMIKDIPESEPDSKSDSWANVTKYSQAGNEALIAIRYPSAGSVFQRGQQIPMLIYVLDKLPIDEISDLHVTALSKTADGNYYQHFLKYYKVKRGYNKFNFPGNLPTGEVILEVMYFYPKQEQGKEYPKVHPYSVSVIVR
jgi:DNA-binding protein H-NS